MISHRLTIFFILLFTVSHSATVFSQPKPTPVGNPQDPTLNKGVYAIQRGKPNRMKFSGTNLADTLAVYTNFASTNKVIAATATTLEVEIQPAPTVEIGLGSVRVLTKVGISSPQILLIDDFAVVEANNQNRTLSTAQKIPVPTLTHGKIAAEQSHYFQFQAKKGDWLTFDCFAIRIGSPLDPLIRLYDIATGNSIPGIYSDDQPGLQGDARLQFQFPKDGDYAVEVRDSRHLGGADWFYHLRICNCPVFQTAFPLSANPNQQTSIAFTSESAVMTPATTVQLKQEFFAQQISQKTVHSGWPVPVLVRDFPALAEKEPNNIPEQGQSISIPSEVSGKFQTKGDKDYFRFAGKKGRKYQLVAETYNMGSTCEVFLQIADSNKKVIQQSDPVKIPATIDFTCPADGDYLVIAEHQNYLHGDAEVYLLKIADSTADFEVEVLIDQLAIGKNQIGSLPVSKVTRTGFAGPITLEIEANPVIKGRTLLETTPYAAGIASSFLPVSVTPDTKPGVYPVNLIASAMIDGKLVKKRVNTLSVLATRYPALQQPLFVYGDDLVIGVLPESPQLTAEFIPASVAHGGNTVLKLSLTGIPLTENMVFTVEGNVPNLKAVMKPIAPKTSSSESTIAFPANIPTGKYHVAVRGTTKVGGKPIQIWSKPLEIAVTAPPAKKK
ncbi:MAG: hypothetical protein R3B84_06350 [Zavarzinella sp.]